MEGRRAIWMAAVVAGLLGLLVAAGCGSGGSSGDAATTTDGSSATSAEAAADSASGEETTEAAGDTGATGAADCSLADKKMVYVSVLRENPILQIMAQGAIDGASEAGFGEAEWLAAQGFDEPGSATLGDQAIAQGVDGIVVFATSPAFYPMIKRAQDAGIPVVQTHSDIPEGDAPGVLSVVAPDPAQYGAEAARTMGEAIGGQGAVAIAQSAFIPNENAAAEAFTATMNAEFPDVRVLKPEVEGGDPPKAIAVDTAIIQANDDLVGAFSTDGNGPVTWATAARDTGRDLTIIGMDYARANLDLVRDGEVYAIVAQPLYEEHAKGSEVLASILCGEEVEYQTLLPSPIVTKDEVDEYYALLDRVNIK